MYYPNAYCSFNTAVSKLGYKEYDVVWKKFVTNRNMLGGHPDIFIGVIPWLYTELLYQFNLTSRQKLSMVIEWAKPWDEVFEIADEKNRSIMHYMTQYRGEFTGRIGLQPAIYFGEDGRCMYSGIVVSDALMAVHIKEWSKD